MLASRSLKRIPRSVEIPLIRHGEQLYRIVKNAHSEIGTGNWCLRTFSTCRRPLSAHTKSSTDPSPSSSRVGYQNDTSFQMSMTRTTKARLTMQLMAEAEQWKYHNCLAIAAQLKADCHKPDLPIYTALMNAASNVAEWQDAWAIFEDMLTSGVDPDVGIMNALLKAQRRRRSPYIWKVLQIMEERNITPNATTFSIIVGRFLDAGNLEMALQYLFATKRYKIIPDFTTTQSVITCAASSGHPRLAIDLISWFEKQSARRFDPTLWMACLISSAEALYKEGVVQCWKTVVHEFNMAPGEGTCNAVLHTAARHGLPDLATDALRILQVIGIPWEEYHFAALIEAFTRNNQVKEAIQTLGIMRTHGIDPLPETTSPVTDVMKDADAIDATWAIVDELHNAGTLDSTAITALIKASVRLGELQRAIGAYKSLSDYGLSADLHVFNLLLQGCVTARHRELGDQLLDDMKAAKIAPDQETYENFISLVLTQKDYEDAFFYLEEMKAAGFRPAALVYETLVEKLYCASDPRGKIAVEEMLEQGYRLGARLQRVMRENDVMMQPRSTHQSRLSLEGAAKTFIETGGLGGAAGLPKERIS